MPGLRGCTRASAGYSIFLELRPPLVLLGGSSDLMGTLSLGWGMTFLTLGCRQDLGSPWGSMWMDPFVDGPFGESITAPPHVPDGAHGQALAQAQDDRQGQGANHPETSG